MIPMQQQKWLMLALMLANGFLAAAQSNSASGATDFAAFSRFITERNIFDPNRVPRSSPNRPSSYHPKATRSAPAFTLVGTMHYQKGMFAFFDGNNSDLRKVLHELDSNSIAGYTVGEITLTGATLHMADPKQTVQLKIGDMMRQEGNAWQMAGQAEASTSMADVPRPATNSTGSAPASIAAPNDVLKKLMQQREQELK